MINFEFILIGLSLGFFWVNILKFGSVKPFTCINCMTGWFSCIVYLIAMPFTFHSVMMGIFIYAPIGNFIGCLFSMIQMRWL